MKPATQYALAKAGLNRSNILNELFQQSPDRYDFQVK